MIAPPFPSLPCPATAAISRSACAAETYPWFVRLNWPVASNEPVPTTQYATPTCISEPCLKAWLIPVGVEPHSWDCDWETCVMKQPLVFRPPSGPDVACGGLPVRPGAPHW